MLDVSNQQLLDAAKAGEVSVLKEWKKQKEGVDVNKVADDDGDTPLHLACQNGHFECVKYLVESAKADANCEGNHGDTPLHDACYNGHLKCAKYLIESCEVNANCEADDGTPLHYAGCNGHLECVKYLVDSAKANANCKDDDGGTPLHYACENGHLECAKYLIDSAKADTNCKDNNGGTPLHLACEYGHLECAKYLIDSVKADANCKNNDDDTPLHLACEYGHLECAKYLVDSAKADANCKNDDGNTPLHLACEYGHLECAKYLVDSAKADTNYKDNDGVIPLHDACYNGHLECVKYLVDSAEANANCKNNQGDTPLHYACSEGHSDCVKCLIESANANIDIDIKNNNNRTPLDVIDPTHQINMMRSIMERLSHLSSQLQLHKRSITSTATATPKHNKPNINTTTNISIGQDRCTAVRTEANADIVFLCGQGDQQQPIKANSGVLVVTVPSIQTLIDSGIHHLSLTKPSSPPSSSSSLSSSWDDSIADPVADPVAVPVPDPITDSIQTTVALPDLQPKYVRHVIECIYKGEISFDESDHDDGDDQPTPILNGQHDLQQLILVADEFGFWRLKLVLEAELARKHLTKDTMIDTLIFAHQHSCSVLEDAAMRVISQNTQACLAHPDFNKITQQPHLMGGIQVLCSGGTVSDGVDDEYSRMSMMELYKVVDEDEGSAQVDSYMDRATLVGFVRSIKSSFESESNSAAEEEDK